MCIFPVYLPPISTGFELANTSPMPRNSFDSKQDGDLSIDLLLNL